MKGPKDYYAEYYCGYMDYTISRVDYESMPCPMDTSKLEDCDMQELATNIGALLLQQFGEPNTGGVEREECEKIEETFWEVMETEGLFHGITYYEED